MSVRSRFGWYALAALAGGGWLGARMAIRHHDDPARLADEVLLRQLAHEMAGALALATAVAERSGNHELTAAAQRWLQALAVGGSWHAFLAPACRSGPGDLWPELSRADDDSFDARAAQAMQDWLEGAREHLQALLDASRPALRRRAAAAIAVVDASARDLDLYPCADERADGAAPCTPASSPHLAQAGDAAPRYRPERQA